jgi:hypothetical protein
MIFDFKILLHYSGDLIFLLGRKMSTYVTFRPECPPAMLGSQVCYDEAHLCSRGYLTYDPGTCDPNGYKKFLVSHQFDEKWKMQEATKILNQLTVEGYAFPHMEKNRLHQLMHGHNIVWVVSTPVTISTISSRAACRINLVNTFFKRICTHIENLLCPKYIFRSREEVIHFLKEVYVEHALQQAFIESRGNSKWVEVFKLNNSHKPDWDLGSNNDLKKILTPVNCSIRDFMPKKNVAAKFLLADPEQLKKIALQWQERIQLYLEEYLEHVKFLENDIREGWVWRNCDHKPYACGKLRSVMDHVLWVLEQGKKPDMLQEALDLFDRGPNDFLYSRSISLGTLAENKRDMESFTQVCYFLWNNFYSIVTKGRIPLVKVREETNRSLFELRAYIPEPLCLEPSKSHAWIFMLYLNQKTGELFHLFRKFEDDWNDSYVPTDAVFV